MSETPAAPVPAKPPAPSKSTLDVPGRPQGSMYQRYQATMDESIARLRAAGGPAQGSTNPMAGWTSVPLMELNAKGAARGSNDHMVKICRFARYGEFADTPDKRRVVEIAAQALAYCRPLFDRPNIAECGNCGQRLPGRNPRAKKQKLWNPFTANVSQACYQCIEQFVSKGQPLPVLLPKPEVNPDGQAPENPHP